MAKRRFLLLIVLLGLTTEVADAASDVCQTLETRFQNIAQRAGDPVAAGRYASAVAQQNLELRKARQDQRRLRCLSSSIIHIRPDGGSDCADLENSIERMGENLSILSSKLQELRGQSTREQLIDELVANGCSLDGIETDEQAARQPYLDTVPDGLRRTNQPVLLPTGNVRTLCVRTCDGGYFPISSQSSATYFERDSALCQQMCPGVETELFYQPSLQAETADMISTSTGRPYHDLPAAFAYRSQGRNESCSCNFSGYHDSARSNASRPVVEPETQSSIQQLRSPLSDSAVPERPIAAQERELDEAALGARKVGPAFLPPDNGTIDLRNPARPGPQPQQE